MALEIERKFLVTDDQWRADVERSVRMRQAYLGGAGVTIRVRMVGGKANLNIKQMRIGPARDEFEYGIPMADALRLADLAEGGQVEKTRHYVRHAGMLWEIDEFHGPNAGLVVAEIELQSVDQSFGKPLWAGEEVTHEERYYNVALAKHPYRKW